MKAILISIKPKWVAKILNGDKTIEIRKTMPKCNLPIDVYIYCTKDKKSKVFGFADRYSVDFITSDRHIDTGLSGYVVAKFTLNKVERIIYDNSYFKPFCHTRELTSQNLYDKSCLSYNEIDNYLKGNDGYALHIDNLEIFDDPKELSEFKQPRDSYGKVNWNANEYYYMELTKAPQSWCYVEVDE